MRCLYCHNPDTWHLEDGQEMSAEEILSRMERNRSFYRTGGITATGGEPMLQIDFLTELFAGAKERGIHTCLDTSGIMFPGCGGTSEEERERLKKVERLLSVTDLVMLDIKHMDAEEHRKLTGQDNEKILAFARYLDEKQIPVWIRHVVVPGITFQREELEALGRFLATLSNVEKLEVLPYHSMGKVKYDNLRHRLCIKRYATAHQGGGEKCGEHHSGGNASGEKRLTAGTDRAGNDRESA